ncbi:UNVERIFIED_CONTAM: hypothetical protein FKN15_059713 [Acipenser sinensis]
MELLLPLKKLASHRTSALPGLIVLLGGSAYYDNVRPLAYPDSDAVLICFDVSRPETLDSVLKKWQSETQEFCPNAKVVLVGCKLDMRTDLSTLLELSKQRLIPVTHEQHIPSLVHTTPGPNSHLPPSKSRSIFWPKNRGTDWSMAGGHSGRSSSQPNTNHGHADRAQAGSSSQGNPSSRTAAGGVGLRTSAPFSVASSSLFWGVGHGLSRSKTAARDDGLQTFPAPFVVAGSSLFWGSGH